MPKVVKSAAREMVLHVKRCCEDERDNNGPLIPFHQVRARVAYLTGVSIRTITNIVREGKLAELSSQKLVTPGKTRKRESFNKIDPMDYCAIRHKINEFYILKHEIPSINKLWSELKKEINFSYSRTTLRSVLKKLGFKCQICKSKQKILVERSDIAAWRAKYISRLRKNRVTDKCPVVFLDERYASHYIQNDQQKIENDLILSSDSVSAMWIKANSGRKETLVPNGLLIFKSQTKSSDSDSDNADKFLQWMNDMIIPTLEPHTLFVMDNATYNSVQIDKAPPLSSAKVDMQAWLKEKRILFDENWTKAQLFQLIKENKGPPVYKIDDLLKQNGHDVVRLPPNHFDLNPIEKVRSILKKRVKETNSDLSSSQTEELTRKAFSSISIEEWISVCEDVQKMEDLYYTTDQLMDAELDKFSTVTVNTSDP